MDRAFANMVEKFDMPRALPEALFEGFVWDAMSKQYKTFDELISYSARVASSVGVMLCVIMGERRAEVLSRACDLGVAMQLTNIARDIGEDAKEGRLYIPLDWFQQEGLDPAQFLIEPTQSKVLFDLQKDYWVRLKLFTIDLKRVLLSPSKLDQLCLQPDIFTRLLGLKSKRITMTI